MTAGRDGPCATHGEVGCGCCEGVRARTTRSTPNRPGKSALHYRIGRHGDFLDTMKARLSSWRPHWNGELPSPLLDLRTRAEDDPSIALLDAWSTVADVLTFYQERLANEGFLRTATERRSVVELARLVGYEPRPGVAAGLFLAYTIDHKTEEEVVIPAGARSQSVPGPGELPQSFETSEPLKARSAWNALRPRTSQPPTWESLWSSAGVGIPSPHRLRLYVKGVGARLDPGDPLLVEGIPGGPLVYRVLEVEPQAPEERTRIEMVPWEATADSEVVELVGELLALMRSGPGPDSGANARAVHEMLGELAELLGSSGLSAAVEGAVGGGAGMLADVRARLASLSAATAPHLVPWLETVEAFLAELEGRLASGAIEASDGGGADHPDAARIRLLAERPTGTLPGAVNLPRALDGSFGANGDAAFRILAATRPDLARTLPMAWASYERATPAPTLKVHAFRVKTGVFGRGFPMRHATSIERSTTTAGAAVESTETTPIGEWPILLGVDGDGRPIATETPDTIHLDGSHEGILPGSWVVLDFDGLLPLGSEERHVSPNPVGSPGDPAGAGSTLLASTVQRVTTKASRAQYGGTGDSTRIRLRHEWLRIAAAEPGDQAIADRDFEVIRGTTVYARSEELELAEQPLEAPVCVLDAGSDYLELDGLYDGLEPGRFVIVEGERADLPDTPGVPAAEAAMLVDVVHAVRHRLDHAPVFERQGPLMATLIGDTFTGQERPSDPLPGDRVHTFVRLERPLAFCYDRRSMTIHANVVRATHGETREEVLGSGDGSKAWAAYALKQRPLTWVSAPTARGVESTLQVFVEGVRWTQVPDFLGRGRTDHVYAVRTDDDGRSTVLFGDGRAGARAPTGVENLQAVYRSGIGRGGNVRAGQVSLLQTRPLGVKEVVNPLRASGGADRESRDQARRNAPLAVQALDRLVSVADYADFARTFAGVGKAVASEHSDGHRSVVHVTVAGVDDAPIDPGSELLTNLRRALRDFGDPLQPVLLDVRELLILIMEAKVKVHADHRWEDVAPAVRAALYDAFGFERRELGQDVVRSEVLSVIQAVRGVDWVDLDVLGAVSASRPDVSSPGGLRPATPQEVGQAVAAVLADEADAARPRARVPVRGTASGTDLRPAQIAVLRPDTPDTLALNPIE